MPGRTQLLAFDHPMLSMPDVDAIRPAWQRLGFTVTPFRPHEMMGGGKTGGRGGNHLVMLTPQVSGTANLLELAYCDVRCAAPLMRRILERPPGLGLMSVNSVDAAATGREWTGPGRAFEPFTADFPWRDPETGATDRIAFTVAVPELWPWIYHTAPITYHSLDHYTRADWLAHPNTALCWRRVTVAVTPAQFDEGRGLLSQLHASEPIHSNGMLEWRCGPTAWRIALADAFADRYAAAAVRADGTPADTAIEVEVRDRNVARRVLEQGGVQMRESALADTVSARDAAGIVLELISA